LSYTSCASGGDSTSSSSPYIPRQLSSGWLIFKNMNNKPEVNGADQYGIKKERQSG